MYETDGIKGKMFGEVFAFPVRVYYEDTDAGGVVYYANYLRFAERARTEFIRCLGKNQVDDLNNNKCAFVVRKVEADYLRPAFLDDMLTVTCKVMEKSGASITVEQEILRGEEILVQLKVKAVYVDIEKKRPIRLPEFLSGI